MNRFIGYCPNALSYTQNLLMCPQWEPHHELSLAHECNAMQKLACGVSTWRRGSVSTCVVEVTCSCGERQTRVAEHLLRFNFLLLLELYSLAFIKKGKSGFLNSLN
jgi:hypothetical protein